jgi:hypothetical protein
MRKLDLEIGIPTELITEYLCTAGINVYAFTLPFLPYYIYVTI